MKNTDRLLSLNRTQADRAFVVVFAVLAAAQFAALRLTPLNLAPDEAQYWDWSRTLDLSYYSKGPLVALLIRIGCLVLGDTELGVRSMAFFCTMLLSAAFYLFLRAFYGSTLALVGWLALRSTVLINAMALVMTTDPPAGLCWLCALAFAAAAVHAEDDRWLVPCFAFVGIGVLGKYTVGLLYLSLVLFFMLNGRTRLFFKRPYFYLGSLIMTAIVSPIIRWNADHGWVNIAHNASHLGSGNQLSFRPHYIFDLLGSQLGLAGPIIFGASCIGLAFGFRRWRSGDLLAGVYLFSCLPLMILCLAVACFKQVYANWPMPAHIGAIALLVHLYAAGDIRSEKARRWIVPGIVLSAALSLLAHLPYIGFTLGLPGERLPTKRLVGWDKLGTEVEQVLRSRKAKTGRIPFVIAEGYETAAAITFYAPSHPRPLCLPSPDRRMSQCDIWADWPARKGQEALIVLKHPDSSQSLDQRFRVLKHLPPAPRLTVDYGGDRLREWHFAFGQGYDGKDWPLPLRR